MANADLAKEFCVPPINPTTGGHLPYGCGDADWIWLRKAADGVVTNASVICNQQIKPYGYINIQGCSHIVIHTYIEFGTGPLTVVNIIPSFALKSNTSSGLPLSVLDWTADTEEVTILATPLTLKYTTEVVHILTILPNPGMPWIRFSTTSTGTDTGSYIDFKVVRGWGAMPFTKNPLG